MNRVTKLISLVAFNVCVTVGLYITSFIFTGGLVMLATVIISATKPEFLAWCAPYLWWVCLLLAVPLWIVFEITTFMRLKKNINEVE